MASAAENTTTTDVVTECQTTDAKKDICDIAAKKECSTATSEANGKQENGTTEHVPEKVSSPEKSSPSKAKASISVKETTTASPAKCAEEKDEKNGTTCKEVPEENGASKPESQEKCDKKETTEKNAAQEKTATPEKNGSPSKGHLKKPLDQLDSVEDGPETKRARRSMEEKCDKTSDGSNCEAVKEENGAAVASN